MGDFFDGSVEGEGVVWIGGDFLDERGGDDVDGDGAGVEHEIALVVGHLGEFLGEVGVFDDGQGVSDAAEDAYFFVGVGFGDHFGAELCGGFGGVGVEANEDGVDDFGVWVVDLEVGELFDASCDHVVECAGVVECFVGAAVAVGVGGQVGWVCQEEVAGGCVEAGHDALLEKLDVVWVESKVVVVVEEGDGLVVVEGAGHDVPGDGGVVFALIGVDGLGEHFKEGFVGDAGGWVAALWAFVAQA